MLLTVQAPETFVFPRNNNALFDCERTRASRWKTVQTVQKVAEQVLSLKAKNSPRLRALQFVQQQPQLTYSGTLRFKVSPEECIKNKDRHFHVVVFRCKIRISAPDCDTSFCIECKAKCPHLGLSTSTQWSRRQTMCIYCFLRPLCRKTEVRIERGDAKL